MLTVSTSGSAGIARSLSHLVAGPYGVPFWLGAVVIGIVVPLALQFAGVIRKTAPAMTALVSVLILVGGDRKSTRLNSSHSQISYAVFCLKKKNTCRRRPHTTCRYG